VSVLDQLKGGDLLDLDQGGRLWELYRQAAAESLYFFDKAIWTLLPAERNLMSKRCHLPLCLVAEDDEIKRLLAAWPRKHMKSTVFTQSRPVHKFVRRVVAGEDPSDRLAIYAATKTNAQRHLREITNVLFGNELFRFLFPELIPTADEIVNQDELTFPRVLDRKEPSIDTLGGGKATSRHYDDITVDDMIDEENFDSPTAVEKAIEYWKLTRNLLEDDDSRLIAVGNFWGMRDLNSYIVANEPDTAVLTASIWGPKLEGKIRCRNLPEPVMELLRAMPQGEPLWPERFSREAYGRLLSELKPRIFSAQYLNDPADPEVTEFKDSWVRECDVVTVDDAGPCVEFSGDDGKTERVPFSAMNLYMAWDPALDGKSATSKNAITVSAIDWKGRIFAVDEHVKREDPLQSMEAFLAMAEKYKPWLTAAGMEEVLFQKVLAGRLQDVAKERGIRLGYKRLKTPTGMRKDQRIRAWLGSLFEARKVYVRRKCVHLREQISTFGVPGADRDAIDSFAYHTQMWQKPPTPDEREAAEEEAEERQFNGGITGYGSALRRSA
jgi:hypothetical protein